MLHFFLRVRFSLPDRVVWTGVWNTTKFDPVGNLHATATVTFPNAGMYEAFAARDQLIQPGVTVTLDPKTDSATIRY